MAKRIFISVVNREFADLRARLRDVLTRAGFDVVVQPDFPHTVEDTIRKLDGLIAPCDLLVHIVGRQSGTTADKPSVKDFFAHTDRSAFLENQPKARKLLGDFSGLSYADWESWLALNRDIDVLVYAVEGHDAADFPGRDQLDCLYLARCHADTLPEEPERCGQIVADVCNHFGVLPTEPEQKIAPPKFLQHSAEHFFDRDGELGLLDEAWSGDGRVNVLSIIAWGGVGKTALLAEWIQNRFVNKGWEDAEGNPQPLRYFDWSFYDAGAPAGEDPESDAADGEKPPVRTGNVGEFFEVALSFFGDRDPNRPGKGARLARHVRKHRSLLILDGLEPLQHPFNHPQAGRLLDPDLADLLGALALQNSGLCIVTSRQSLTDLSGLRGTATPEHELEELPTDAAVRLLRKLQITGSDAELKRACEELGGHALSLTLLGRFLFDAHGGDILRRDTVDLPIADIRTRPDRRRTASKVLEAYEQWLGSTDGRREDLAVLRLMGLFDRPARPDCLKALRREPSIPGLTDGLVGLGDAEWNILLRRLQKAGLIALRNSRPARPKNSPPSAMCVDAHPLIREYFAKQLRNRRPEGFRCAHRRLYEHLTETTEYRPDTLEGLQPLYEAVAHGSKAGMVQEAYEDIYTDRILRGMSRNGYYSTNRLGAIGADLGAVACFFEEPWESLSPELSKSQQAWLLNAASFRLRALGRLSEAMAPMKKSLKTLVKWTNWKQAAGILSDLSHLELTLGKLGAAVRDAKQSVSYAFRGGDQAEIRDEKASHARALHQAGQLAKALSLFEEAEAIQADLHPQYPQLDSVEGFHYWDLLLSDAERATWRRIQRMELRGQKSENRQGLSDLADDCRKVEQRARGALQRATQNGGSLLTLALVHLAVGRAGLYRHILRHPTAAHSARNMSFLAPVAEEITAAVNALRESGHMTHIPAGLLIRALLRPLMGNKADSRSDLEEAQRIAERGPMRLHLADIHLTRARLFRDREELQKAAALIEETGYHRRDEELQDAREALGGSEAGGDQ